jgi:hypothetical protein
MSAAAAQARDILLFSTEMLFFSGSEDPLEGGLHLFQ